jgi:UDP-glucuronate 4-epimerase
VLEAARELPPKHLVFASSSSVYGADAASPFREDAPMGKPLSFYAATKQANEGMAYNHARNHGLNITGLRFFTAYGPWGRPDMTPILFANAIRSGTPIKLYNHGLYRRDFTYIDDIVDGILKALLYPPAIRPDPQFRIFNLGNNKPIEMIHFVQLLEEALGKKALIEMLPPQPTEMPETCADLSAVQAAIAYSPRISLEEGVKRFVAWHREYYP